MQNERTIDIAIRLADERGWSQTDLARELGTTPSSLSNWKNRGMPASYDALAAKAFNMTVDQFHAGGQTSTNVQPQAHLMSLVKFTVPPTIKWEDLHTMVELPDFFTVLMPNTSLSGHVDKGTSLIFARDLTPTPGKVVLARNADTAEVRIGIYVAFDTEHWQLQPKAHGHPSWDSKAHNITVLATLKWRED